MSTLKVNAITNTSGGTDISGVGIIQSYAIIADVKSNNTNGGTFTSGDWRTRDLNTEIADADGIVSISSNQFTLQAGTYKLNAAAPSHLVNRHQLALYNVTDSSYTQYGINAYNASADSMGTNAVLFSRFTIASQKVFEIRHRCQTTSGSQGFGIGIGSQWTSAEIYCLVEIFKEV